jgi:hypothetical protein
VSGKFTITGAVELGGDFTVLYPIADGRLNRCDRIASSAVGSYVIPSPTIVGEARLMWTAVVHFYKGPGEYHLSDLEALGIEITPTANAPRLVFEDAAATTSTVKVDDHNSGTFEFSGMKDKAGAPLSGSISWTCA